MLLSWRLDGDMTHDVSIAYRLRVLVRRMRNVRRDVRGSSLTEYLIIVVCVALPSVAAVYLFGGNVRARMEVLANCVARLSSCAAGADSDHSDAPVTGQASPSRPAGRALRQARSSEVGRAAESAVATAAAANQTPEPT